MTHTGKESPSTVPCHACSGRFSFGFETAADRFICRHTRPYCPAFEAIASTLDALRFAEKCDQALRPIAPPVPPNDDDEDDLVFTLVPDRELG